MLTEAKIDSAVKALFDGIQFPSSPEGLYGPLRYMVEIGGKRLRPRLCLTAYSLFEDKLGEEILSPAAGLEVFHTFTLIHDDIMDRSPLRRGHETVWKKWSGDTAILSGDVMCIDSYRRIAKAPEAVLAEVLDLFTSTAAGVCEGQQMDMDFEKQETVPMEDYMEMIGLKTAVLIACSAKMGALIGGAKPRQAEELYRFGYDLGLAFQVADDYLDAFGDSSVFGKPIGGDIVNDKKSWLTVRAIEKSGGAAELFDALAMASGTEAEKAAKIASVKDLYVKYGVDEDAKYEIIRLNESAMSHAAKAVRAGSLRYEVLHRFADRLVGRTR